MTVFGGRGWCKRTEIGCTWQVERWQQHNSLEITQIVCDEWIDLNKVSRKKKKWLYGAMLVLQEGQVMPWQWKHFTHGTRIKEKYRMEPKCLLEQKIHDTNGWGGAGDQWVGVWCVFVSCQNGKTTTGQRSGPVAGKGKTCVPVLHTSVHSCLNFYAQNIVIIVNTVNGIIHVFNRNN